MSAEVKMYGSDNSKDDGDIFYNIKLFCLIHNLTYLPKSVSAEVKMSLAETILRMSETFFMIKTCFLLIHLQWNLDITSPWYNVRSTIAYIFHIHGRISFFIFVK